MKLTHILGLIVIAVALAVVVSTAGDSSSYVAFEEAYDVTATTETEVHVVGTLKKNQQGQPLGIATAPDKLSFTFTMVDDQGREEQVFYGEPMPPDFLRSEQVVVIGGFKKDRFVASQILLKCPSKYQDQESPTQQAQL
jgi:cytochrome c-type biogenesis protein CcmE